MAGFGGLCRELLAFNSIEWRLEVHIGFAASQAYLGKYGLHLGRSRS